MRISRTPFVRKTFVRDCSLLTADSVRPNPRPFISAIYSTPILSSLFCPAPSPYERKHGQFLFSNGPLKHILLTILLDLSKVGLWSAGHQLECTDIFPTAKNVTCTNLLPCQPPFRSRAHCTIKYGTITSCEPSAPSIPGISHRFPPIFHSSTQEDNLALIYIDRYDIYQYLLLLNPVLIWRFHTAISFMKLQALKPSRDCMYPNRSRLPDDLNHSMTGGAPVDKFVAQIVPSQLWTIMSRTCSRSPSDYMKPIPNKI